MKFVSVLEKLIKTDRVTVMNELLSYVRVFVEVFVDEEMLEYLSFEKEWGEISYIFIKYE